MDSDFGEGAPVVAHAHSSSTGIGVFGFIIICVLVWFFFLRVDYKDVWWNGTQYQKVTYCGPVGNSNCHSGNSYILPVNHVTRSGDTHTFIIQFDNGGYVETYGNCMKDESNLYPGTERYCYTTSTDTNSGQLGTYLISK